MHCGKPATDNDPYWRCSVCRVSVGRKRPVTSTKSNGVYTAAGHKKKATAMTLEHFGYYYKEASPRDLAARARYAKLMLDDVAFIFPKALTLQQFANHIGHIPHGKDRSVQNTTILLPVMCVMPNNGPVHVYDLSIDGPLQDGMGSHNFVAAGCVVHNCYTTELKMPGDRTPAGVLVPHNLAPDTGAKFVHSEIRKGLLPMILKHLLDSRDQAKAMMKRCAGDPARKKLYDSKQLQLKIIANSVYGVLTASGGWFVRMEIGESVTSWGRSMIHQAKLVAESAPFFAEVIYGYDFLHSSHKLTNQSQGH